MKDTNKGGNSISNRDPNDEKVMATSAPAPAGETNRQIDASMQTLNNSVASPIDAYYSFPSSNVKAVDTYSKRMETIAGYLGNRDEVKG